MSDPSPDPAAFEAAARATIERLPDEFREGMQRIVLRIDEFASAAQLASVGIDDRWDLTGLYEGIPLTEQSSWISGDMPPVISLFRQPLLREMRETGAGFEELVSHVVIHEAGHHFGFSDDDMHALEDMVRD
ncbi:metallopeptidase family protein [Qipengyuania nanhaisediminis]|uniref:metallopeptidase family protein n=1 Tax=Qipengyuania nanhaisediminis TaxID=604088 RepID=UPI0038B2C23C